MKHRGKVATFGLNVATFSRVYFPTSRRSRRLGLRRCKVLEGWVCDVATLKSHVATFQRVLTSDVVTLESHVESLQKGVHNRGSQCRDVEIQCRCHTPDPGPTRLANPNRFRGVKPYTGTAHYFFIFFFFSFFQS